eukprot:667753-Amphidinium_carterae.1
MKGSLPYITRPEQAQLLEALCPKGHHPFVVKVHRPGFWKLSLGRRSRTPLPVEAREVMPYKHM